MRGLVISMMVALVGATAAQAGSETQGQPRVIACYKEEKIGAQYSVKKVLIQPAERKYLKKGDVIRLVEYPAVYREDRKLIKPAHVVMKEIPCG
jgi:hypothetical protein